MAWRLPSQPLLIAATVLLFLEFNHAAIGDTARYRGISIVTPWKKIDSTVLYPSPATKNSASSNRNEEVSPVYLAAYHLDPTKMYHAGRQFNVGLVQDRRFNRTCILDWGQFYLSKPDGITGYTLGMGVLYFSHDFVSVSGIQDFGKMAKRLEGSFDADASDKRETARFDAENKIDLEHSAPKVFWLDKMVEEGNPVSMELVSEELDDDVLIIQIKRFDSFAVSKFWIKIAEKKVIRSVIAGVEMDLANRDKNGGYPLPVKESVN